MGLFTTFFHSQLFVTPTYPTQDFSGQTVIVTGSNTGLGLEAARHFARLGCTKLILAVRSVDKGERARDDILASLKSDQKSKAEGNSSSSSTIDVWPIDLGDSDSVKAFCHRAAGLARVDAIVENAGLGGGDWVLLNGRQSTLQVNVVNTCLMAVMLLPKLRETAKRFDTQTHLVLVTSELYGVAKFKERNEADIYAALNDEKKFDRNDRYNVTKLMEVLFVRELVKHMAEKDVGTPGPIVNCVNPGLCTTELLRNENSFIKFAIGVMQKLLARTPEVGSRTLVAGVTAGPESHGQYMSDGVNQELWPNYRTEESARLQQKVFEQTMTLLDSIEPGVSKNL